MRTTLRTIFFEMCTRTLGNLALKCIWKAFIHLKVKYLSFEKTKEITFAENLRADKEVIFFMPKWKNWTMKQNLWPKYAQRNH